MISFKHVFPLRLETIDKLIFMEFSSEVNIYFCLIQPRNSINQINHHIINKSDSNVSTLCAYKIFEFPIFHVYAIFENF